MLCISLLIGQYICCLSKCSNMWLWENPLSWKGYMNCINVKEYLDFRKPLNRVLVAALTVQVPDRILRAQGQNLKQKMYYGKTCYTVQNADLLVPVRQMWKILRLIHVWKKNIETTLFIRLVYSAGLCGAISLAPLT